MGLIIFILYILMGICVSAGLHAINPKTLESWGFTHSGHSRQEYIMLVAIFWPIFSVWCLSYYHINKLGDDDDNN